MCTLYRPSLVRDVTRFFYVLIDYRPTCKTDTVYHILFLLFLRNVIYFRENIKGPPVSHKQTYLVHLLFQLGLSLGQ